MLNSETLYELRRIVAQCPSYQAARILLLENLFLLHDPAFEAELRAAALFVPDREVLFRMVESLNYEMEPPVHHEPAAPVTTGNRTLDIIGSFLDQAEQPQVSGKKRRAIDPVSDYMSLLEDMDDADAGTEPGAHTDTLLDEYLQSGTPTLRLDDTPASDINGAPEPDADPENMTSASPDDETSIHIKEEYFTETLAKVFIKQGNYERAIEILTKINLENPRKNAYFADQIRFLRKLAINNQHKKAREGGRKA